MPLAAIDPPTPRSLNSTIDDVMGPEERPMRRHSLTMLFVAIAACLTLAACGGENGETPPPEPNCETTADCDGENAVCLSGYCQASCETASDCEDGETCFGGACVTDCSDDPSACDENFRCTSADVCWSESDAASEPCETDRDCAFNQYCANNSCRSNDCESDEDCEGSNICSDGACGTGCRAGDDVDEALTCPDGQTCDEQTNQCEAVGCEMGECGTYQECPTDEEQPSCQYTGNCGDDAGVDPDVVCESYAIQIGSDIEHTCQNGQCQKVDPCENDTDCDQNEICDVRENERNVCRAGCRCTNAAETEGCNVDCEFGEVCNLPDDDDETGGGEGGEFYTCLDGCTTNADCGQNEVCLDSNVCQPTCDSRDDCDNGQLCTGDPRICRPCSTEAGGPQCPADEICDPEGLPESDGQGLCIDEPPPCPDDAYGTNHCGSQAYDISANDSLPFSATPTYCSENADGESNACETLNQEWFRVDVPGDAERVIHANLTYPETTTDDDGNEVSTGNLDLALYGAQEQPDGSLGPNDTELVTSSRPPTQEDGEEAIKYGVRAAGTAGTPRPYFVQVRGSVPSDASPVDYELNVDVKQAVSCSTNDDSLEENDTLQTATSVSAGTTETGLRVCGEDRDFYELDVNPNQNVSVTAKAPPRLGNVGLKLYNGDTGDLLDNGTATTDQVEETVTFTTRSNPPSTIVAEVFVEPSQSGVGNVEYDFTWNQQQNQCADQFEPNDICDPDDRPSPLTVINDNFGDSNSFSGTPVCQSPGTQGEGDYYRFELDPLDEFDFEMTYNPADEEGQLQVTLFGPNSCQTLLQSASTSTDPSTGDVTKTVSLDSSDVQIGGNYYVQIAIFQSNAEVNYDWNYNITPGPACAQDQYDTGGSSNDTRQDAVTLSASNIKSGGEDSVFNNMQICTNDSDWYCTNLDPTQHNSIEYEVRFDHSDNDLDAFLVGPDSSGSYIELDSSTSTTDDETVSVSNVTQAGDYCLHVKGKNPVRNNYSVLPFVDGQGNVDPACPDRYENNDQCTSPTGSCTAKSIPTGQVEQNLRVCSGDDDWYAIDADPGQEITANIEYDPSVAPVDMRVLEETDFGAPIAGPTSGTSSPKTLTWETTRQQTFYLETYTSGGSFNNFYNLQVDKTNLGTCEDDSYDTGGSSNDSASNAVSVSAPGLEVSRRICDSNVDWYKIDNVTTGRNFEAFVNYDYSIGDVDLTVYGPNDSTTSVGSSTTTNDDDSVLVTDPAGGTYYIKVEPKNPARVDYDLLVYSDLNDNNTIEPSLGEGPEDKQCPDQLENNDSASEATEVSITDYDRLTMCADNGNVDDDYYQVYVPQDAQLTADFTFEHDKGDIDVTLYEGTSTSGTVVDSSTSDDDGETVSMSSDSTGSTYLLEVIGDTSTSGNNFRNMYGMNLSLTFSGSCTEDTFGGLVGSGNHLQGNAATLNAEDYDGNYDLTLCEDSNGDAKSDWFEFTTSSSAPALFSLDHTASQGEIEMELIDSSDNTESTSSALFGSTDNTQEIDIASLPADTYYLKISSASGAPIRNEYDLYASFGGSSPAEPYCPDIYERNDDSGGGTPASLNYPSTLAFTEGNVCGSETDWYTADLQSGSTYRFETYFDHSASTDVDVQVLDPSGSIVTDVNSSQISFSGSSSSNDEIYAFDASNTDTYKFGLKNDGSGEVAAPFQITTESMYSVDGASSDCPSDIAGSNQSLAPTVGSSLPYTNGFGLCSSDDWVRWTSPSSISSDVRVTVYHDNSDYSGSSLTTLNFGLDVSEQGGCSSAPCPGNDPAPSDFSSDPRDNRATVTFTPKASTTYFLNIQRGLSPGTNDTTHGPYILDIEWVSP